MIQHNGYRLFLTGTYYRALTNIPYGVDKDDPMWAFLNVIKEVDLKKYLRSH